MKNKFYFVFAWSLLTLSNGFSQENKSDNSKENTEKNSVVMTWNKDTPEEEMKDDIKALGDYGVTISYSNVKRNSNKEITAIKVEYADKSGSRGSMDLDNQKPINTIRFFKNGDDVGFGEPANSDFLAGTDFGLGENFMKQFNFAPGSPNGQSFNFSFPPNNGGGSWGNSNSKIIIQSDGKKPLVIEDGKITEGGEDYSAEELDEIKKNNKFESFGGNDNLNFDFYNKQGQNTDAEQTIKELRKTKEEMLKAKEEMEKATKELRKAKSSMKTQKA